MEKTRKKILLTAALLILATASPALAVRAQSIQDKTVTSSGVTSDTEKNIEQGIYIGDMDVAGKTTEQARQAVEDYLEEVRELPVTFYVAEGKQIEVKAGDLGLVWSNPEVVEEAVTLGKKGNMIQRYKVMSDLKHENRVYDLEVDLDQKLVRQILEEQCSQFNVEAVDAVLTRTETGFSVTPGQDGILINTEASIEKIFNYLTEEWDFQEATIELVAEVDQPRGSEEELAMVKDVLGSFTTSYSSSGRSRSGNIENGCRLISGITLYPGDEFSMYENVAPYTRENGYFMANSYMNGRVVDSLGGGICQVSTTLYNAVLLAELEITERHNHSMIVSYVDPSADAAIAESSNKDFRFVNNLEHPVYIDGVIEGKNITINIYGVETRPTNRQVKYESEIVSVNRPQSDIIHTSVAMPLGQVVTESAHIGYKANLWKVVTENGVEVSREKMNSSSYKMVPRTATVGLSTNDVNAYNEMLAAVATNNIDHVKNVAAALAHLATPEQPPAAPAPAPAPAPAAPAEQPPAQ